MSHPLLWETGETCPWYLEEEGLSHRGNRHPDVSGPRKGVWDHIDERRVGCGEVLKRERDLTTDVDTVISVETSIAK